MAGVVGFEPTVHATKKRCLTTWLHPNCDRLVTQLILLVQGAMRKNVGVKCCLDRHRVRVRIHMQYLSKLATKN